MEGGFAVVYRVLEARRVSLITISKSGVFRDRSAPTTGALFSCLGPAIQGWDRALHTFLQPSASQTMPLIENRKLTAALKAHSLSLSDVAARVQQRAPSTMRLLVVDQFAEPLTAC